MDTSKQNSCGGKEVEGLENKQSSQDVNVYHSSFFGLSSDARCLATEFC